MTTEEQAPVRCRQELIGSIFGDERCVFGANHTVDYHLGEHGSKWKAVPAPEETVERRGVCDATIDKTDGRRLYCWALAGHSGEHFDASRNEFFTVPPAPEPAGEAEERCWHESGHLWLQYGDKGKRCERCDLWVPAPSSGTPGLTEALDDIAFWQGEAERRWPVLTHDSESYLARERSRRRVDFTEGCAFGAAEARRPLEQALANKVREVEGAMRRYSERAEKAEQALREIEALDTVELNYESKNYEGAFWAAYRIAERALSAVGGADDVG